MAVQWWRPDADSKPVLAHAMRNDLLLGPYGLASFCGAWWLTTPMRDWHGRGWDVLKPGDSWCRGKCRRCRVSVLAQEAK